MGARAPDVPLRLIVHACMKPFANPMTFFRGVNRQTLRLNMPFNSWRPQDCSMPGWDPYGNWMEFNEWMRP